MRHLTPAERKRIADHAAPEAIAAMRRDLHAEQLLLTSRLLWLEEVTLKRERQIAGGTWPPVRKENADA